MSKTSIKRLDDIVEHIKKHRAICHERIKREVNKALTTFCLETDCTLRNIKLQQSDLKVYPDRLLVVTVKSDVHYRTITLLKDS